MKPIEFYVMSGELKCDLVDETYQLFLQRLRQPIQSAKLFEDARGLLSCVSKYLENELSLFVEALARTSTDHSQLSRRAHVLRELLEDIVMLHADEPDGSFLRGLGVIAKAFQQLVSSMRATLHGLSEGNEQKFESTERVFMLSAA
jgi:hypothetical protein